MSYDRNYVLVAILCDLRFFGTFAHKKAQTWFVLHETWQRKQIGINYCVEVVRNVNHSHMLETWFVLHETWHIKLFGIYYCVEVGRIVNHSHMLKITC